MTSPEVDLAAERFGVYDTNAEGTTTITFTRTLDHPIDKVWRAITIAEHRAAWFPELSLVHEIDGAAIVNFSGSDCPPPEDNPSDVDYCKVTRFEPPNLLEYIGPTEHHRFELQPKGTGCQLRFLAILPKLNKFDDDSQTIQSRFSVACGWHYKLDQMQWSLDDVAFDNEGYAGPTLTKLYFVYLKQAKN